MQFEIVGVPIGKSRPKFSTIHGFAQAIKPKEDVYYENLVKISFQQGKSGDYDLFDKPIKMKIEAFFDIPKTFSKKRTIEATEGRISPQKKPDADNIAKIICDALNNVAYKDDTQIVDAQCRKFYSDEPRVEVVIREISS